MCRGIRIFRDIRDMLSLWCRFIAPQLIIFLLKLLDPLLQVAFSTLCFLEQLTQLLFRLRRFLVLLADLALVEDVDDF